MNTKTLGIYIQATPTSPLGDFEPYYIRAYEGLISELIKLGCTPVIIYQQENTYLGKGKFKAYWQISKTNGALKYDHQSQEIKVDFVLDKNRFNSYDVKTSVPAQIREICSDKYLSCLFAPKLHARSYYIADQAQFDAFKISASNKRIVLKELDSKGGKGVFIGDASGPCDNLKPPIIAQEFIDTSIGIDGICKGIHDLRVILYNGEIISLMLRQPMNGGFKTNLGFGGKHRELDISLVPQEITEISQQIDNRFAIKTDRLYSIDFGNSPDGWKVIELNCWPGLGYDSENEKLFTKRLAKHLVHSLQNA
jgi:hypothetical protein